MVLKHFLNVRLNGFVEDGFQEQEWKQGGQLRGCYSSPGEKRLGLKPHWRSSRFKIHFGGRIYVTDLQIGCGR